MSVRLTKQQQHHLLNVYVERGYAAAKPLAIAMGVTPQYPAQLAARRGVKTKVGYRPQCPPNLGHKDPRWARAIERGAVSI